MIIVNITGGLGNQFFQYAFAYSLAKKRQTQLKLDITAFKTYKLRQYKLDRYFITEEIATTEEVKQLKYKQEHALTRLYRKLIKIPRPLANTYYKEPHFQLDKNTLSQQGSVYFDGYWQSYKYFQDYRESFLDIFTLKENIHTNSKKYLQQILNNKAVSIHIRRGDYASNKKTNSVHGTCSLTYYQNGISYITQKIKDPHFFVFSDDLHWARDNLIINGPLTFIELNHGNSDCDEMLLMSHCEHNIIANSSFSWWGAWLNQNPNKIVVAPQHWFRDASIKTEDLIPESWTRI